MKHALLDLIDRLNNPIISETKIITWSCPIPSFGDLYNSKIATVGLNPSNREFVDSSGNELDGNHRRFHTLKSLGIDSWSMIHESKVERIAEHCLNYFVRNPYDKWFKKLDYIISGTRLSYYFPSRQACHVDLIPYATSVKWVELSFNERYLILDLAGDTLGILLRDSPVELIVLNGQAVVDNIKKISKVELDKQHMPDWTLPRKSNGGVAGYSYRGVIESLGGINLNRKIKVVGYNHNIQSSYGVSAEVQTSIRNWISNLWNDTLL